MVIVKLSTVAVVVAALLAVGSSALRYNVIQEGPQRLKVVSELDVPFLQGFANPSVVATGEFNDTLSQTGWNTLSIVTSPIFADEDQAYAAGFFEGQVTYQQAVDSYQNSFLRDPVIPVIDEFFTEHVAWLEAMIASNNKTDPYWYQAGLMWLQFRGMLAGLNTEPVVGEAFTVNKLLALTAMGDLFDLRAAFDANSTYRQDWRKMKKKEFESWFAHNTHCSSLFKLTATADDIFFGHAAWYDFYTMLRIFKHMTLNFNNPMTNAKTISYSSYPGMLSSFDDFYLTDSGFGVIETSLAVFNLTMYKGNIVPQSVLYWMRVMISTRSTTSAPQWTELVARYNSGTYNNQWMVLDLNLFTPGQPLPPNTMWVAEQLPGVVKSQDVTEFLQYGYYPSYNVPMNKELYEVSGYAEATKIHGPEMDSYTNCVRAEIFRRDQATVTDLESFQHIMQYNDFEQDPISKGNPLYAIASRVDLDPDHPQCFGALDSKVSSWKMWKAGQKVMAFSGPTPQQPRFQFNTTAAKCGQHKGVPMSFDFGWQHMSP